MNGRRKIDTGGSRESEHSSTSTSTPSKTSDPIHIKYRPRKLSEVVGQKAVVASLKAALSSKSPNHCYLFTGPAGTGKTTLGRIVASEFRCDPASIIEVDAASKSGVDDVRELCAPLRYQGFGATPNKAVIVDECHRLSKQAWDGFLKITEDCPPHVYFVFCSTEPEKVPPAIKTRALAYNLLLVRHDDLMDVLEDVANAEGYRTPERFLSMVAQAAGGSPRQALTLLAAVHACEDEDEVRELLAAPAENAEVIDLCRAMLKGDLHWSDVTKLLKDLKDTPPETIRILIVNYLNACTLGARSDKEAIRMLDMLEAFSKPCNPQDKVAPLLIAFGRIVFPS